MTIEDKHAQAREAYTEMHSALQTLADLGYEAQTMGICDCMAMHDLQDRLIAEGAIDD